MVLILYVFAKNLLKLYNFKILSKYKLQKQMMEVASNHQVLWVGIGCARGTSRQLIQKAIEQIFTENQLPETAIAGVATINLKSHETGLVELCQQRNLPLKTFPCDVLNKVFVPNPSKVVAKQVGTPSVAEAAALCAASNLTPLEPPHPGTIEELGKLLVAKQIFRLEGQPGAVTVAVAQMLPNQ